MFVFTPIHKKGLEIMIYNLTIKKNEDLAAVVLCGQNSTLKKKKKKEQMPIDVLISPYGLFVFWIASFEPIVLKFIALALQALTE